MAHNCEKNPSRHAYNVSHGQSDDIPSEPEPDNSDEDDFFQKLTTTSCRKRTT